MTPTAALVVLTLTQAFGPDPGPRGALWTEPLGAAAYFAVTATGNAGTWARLPIGLSLRMSEASALEAEFAYFTGCTGCGDSDGSPGGLHQISFAGGVSFGSDAGLRGWFLHPRLVLSNWWLDSGRGGRNLETFEVMVGLDAGYRWTPGPFFIAVAPGFAAGLAIPGRGQLISGPLFWEPRGAEQPWQPVFELNVDLLRAGFTF